MERRGNTVSGLEPYVTIDVAADFLGVKTSWLYQAGDAEGIPVHRIGRARRYRLSELEAFMQRDAA